MYRTTLHFTTGASPAELMFGRKLRTKLPALCDVGTDDIAIRDCDCERKGKGKMYTDMKRNAQESDIQAGDKVLVKRDRMNKFATNFCPIPLTVVQKSGNSVTIQSDDGVQYKRNVTRLKPFIEREIQEEEESQPTSANNAEPLKPREVPDTVQPEKLVTRPTRIRRMPDKYKDYVSK